MKRRVTREEIIRTTRDLIIRNGIRAVRVDEIAQKLEISKRTLYELFSDKDTLVEQCWDKIREEQEKKIAGYLFYQPGSALEQARNLIQEYIAAVCMIMHFASGVATEGFLCRFLRKKPSFLAGLVYRSTGTLRRRRQRIARCGLPAVRQTVDERTARPLPRRRNPSGNGCFRVGSPARNRHSPGYRMARRKKAELLTFSRRRSDNRIYRKQKEERQRLKRCLSLFTFY